MLSHFMVVKIYRRWYLNLSLRFSLPIILALDTILGSQILFTNGYEKRITVYTVFAGLPNLGLNSLLFFNHIVAPEYYLLTTMLSEALSTCFLISFSSIENNLFTLGHIFSYTVRYSSFHFPL